LPKSKVAFTHLPGGKISSLSFSQSPSAAAVGLDFGDVNLAHFYHRGEEAFGFSSVRSEIFVALPPTKFSSPVVAA